MSDCSMGGRRFYNVPTHRPIEDRLDITIRFKGEHMPYTVTLNRMDREVDGFIVDGERFERVRECGIKDATASWGWLDERDCIYTFHLSCGHSVDSLMDDAPKYCEACGAKVKVGE